MAKTPIIWKNRNGVTAALAAATLFGVSTPLAKLLVREISPWMLAGLLYLGSGIGLAVIRLCGVCCNPGIGRLNAICVAGIGVGC